MVGLSLLWLLLLGACVVDTSGGGEQPALAWAMRLSASTPQLLERLAATVHGFTVREGATRSPGASASHLHATLAEQADGNVTLGHGVGPAHAMRWRLEGARDAALELDGGRAVYRDALESVDVVWTAEETRAELFLLLRDEAAPTTFRWSVQLGAGLVKGEAEATGGVAFVDENGRKRLRVGAAFAVDAKGTRRDAVLSWNDGALSLSVDTRGLAFPVLVDPPVETVEWDLAVPASSAPPLTSPAMAYDSARGKTVLFGGEAGFMLMASPIRRFVTLAS